jgi:hypothetical protein
MTRLLELLRSLGNAGAVANAGALATARRREDWVVEGLERRTAPAVSPLAGTPATRRTA